MIFSGGSSLPLQILNICCSLRNIEQSRGYKYKYKCKYKCKYKDKCGSLRNTNCLIFQHQGFCVNNIYKDIWILKIQIRIWKHRAAVLISRVLGQQYICILRIQIQICFFSQIILLRLCSLNWKYLFYLSEISALGESQDN